LAKTHQRAGAQGIKQQHHASGKRATAARGKRVALRASAIMDNVHSWNAVGNTAIAPL